MRCVKHIPVSRVLVGVLFSIVLTFRKREGVKRQSYFQQIQRDKQSSISLVDVENDKGVKLDE